MAVFILEDTPVLNVWLLSASLSASRFILDVLNVWED